MYVVARDKGRSQPTYEELKLILFILTLILEGGSQPTYEELKRLSPSSAVIKSGSSQPTYEELKQFKIVFNLTYKAFSAYL